MITDDGNRWCYLAVKSLSALLWRISSSNNGDFYCLNCFYSYSTLNKLKKHERACFFCHADMREEVKNILKYRSGDKSLKVSFIVYADLECLLKKEQSRQNSCTQRKAKHETSDYSLSWMKLFIWWKKEKKEKKKKLYQKIL